MTCVGKDIEIHLPHQLEILLAMIRDAFLNSSASAPSIRRTLLQLIELQASQYVIEFLKKHLFSMHNFKNSFHFSGGNYQATLFYIIIQPRNEMLE